MPNLIEKKDQFAALHNLIINSNLGFRSDIEIKIFLEMLYKVLSGQEKGTKLFEVELFEAIDFTGGKQYNLIKQKLIDIKKIVFTPVDDEAKQCFHQYVIIPNAKIKNKKIYAKFESDFVDFINENRINFTKVPLLHVMPMQSIYSIKLYTMFLKEFSYRDIFEISLEKLRKLLNLDNHILSDVRDFKKRILNQAQKEFLLYANIKFRYESIKDWRVITGFKFYLSKSAPTDSKVLRLLDNSRLIKDNPELFASEIMKKHIPAEVAAQIKDEDPEKIIYYFEKAKKTKDINDHNFGRYLFGFIFADLDNFKLIKKEAVCKSKDVESENKADELIKKHLFKKSWKDAFEIKEKMGDDYIIACYEYTASRKRVKNFEDYFYKLILKAVKNPDLIKQKQKKTSVFIQTVTQKAESSKALNDEFDAEIEQIKKRVEEESKKWI